MTEHNNTAPWPHDRLIHGYWVILGRLLATEYPGAKEPKALRSCGFFRTPECPRSSTLTEAGEPTWDGTPMLPYARLLEPAVGYRRFAIPDTSVIDDKGLRQDPGLHSCRDRGGQGGPDAPLGR